MISYGVPNSVKKIFYVDMGKVLINSPTKVACITRERRAASKGRLDNVREILPFIVDSHSTAETDTID